jgi:tRNA(adenine34) deaminase
MSEAPSDLFFMREALKEAKKAFEKDEVPVGAVLVQDGRVIARGHNQVEMLQDATAHAEVLCLTSGATALQNWRLTGTTLYCTLEPCCMCAGAMLSCRIDRLVYAAPDLRVGVCGSWIDLFSKEHPIHSIEIVRGVLEEEAGALMREFFQATRKKKKNEPGSIKGSICASQRAD